jgi:enoyl-CoA hydratase
MGLVKELAYTGRRLSAIHAFNHGLVTQVFETQEAMVNGALACAKEMANKPPVAIWGTKQALNYARDHSVEDSLRQMGWLQGAIWSNPHIREALEAAKEKRPANFPSLAPLKSFKSLG